MSQQTETERFINDLNRFASVRSEVAVYLHTIADTIKEAELAGDSTSGKLSLERDIEDLILAQKNLRSGVFRLMVLGDMKRGKSTFLNALIGENLLPSDVNPCTAVLTILRYGPEKQVTIYFKDGKKPQQLDFHSFKHKYTIDPAEAKKLEQEHKQAFPDVDYAVVEYPLSFLEKGIEIVDSPGLNDTEARNELSLGYINNCHAILFVLRASQPCTLAERRYLENYIKGRGLSVFFLINAWDQVRESLIDPDDRDELKEAEERLRQVFQANLAEYCYIDGYCYWRSDFPERHGSSNTAFTAFYRSKPEVGGRFLSRAGTSQCRAHTIYQRCRPERSYTGCLCLELAEHVDRLYGNSGCGIDHQCIYRAQRP